MMAGVRIGVSGWKYPGWKAVFYPRGLPARRELEFASRRFSTIEINGTFYSLKRPETFAQWARETPEAFLFAVKGSRYITHMLRLRGVDAALANFFAQGLLELGAKLGPILWQLPPDFRFDGERLEAFFARLPRSFAQASELAGRHDTRLDGRASVTVTEALEGVSIRHAVEIRHESFVAPEFVELLRRQNVGLVVADAVAWPLLLDVTSDFVYIRLHGSKELYASGYDEPALEVWAKRISAWRTGAAPPEGRYADAARRAHSPLDVFVYFDNDAKVRAPFDAHSLEEKVRRKQAS